MATFKPQGDIVAIRREKSNWITQRPSEGIILAIGPNVNRYRDEEPLTIGDRVVYSYRLATRADGMVVDLINHINILSVVEDNNAE